LTPQATTPSKDNMIGWNARTQFKELEQSKRAKRIKLQQRHQMIESQFDEEDDFEDDDDDDDYSSNNHDGDGKQHNPNEMALNQAATNQVLSGTRANATSNIHTTSPPKSKATTTTVTGDNNCTIYSVPVIEIDLESDEEIRSVASSTSKAPSDILDDDDDELSNAECSTHRARQLPWNIASPQTSTRSTSPTYSPRKRANDPSAAAAATTTTTTTTTTSTTSPAVARRINIEDFELPSSPSPILSPDRSELVKDPLLRMILDENIDDAKQRAAAQQAKATAATRTTLPSKPSSPTKSNKSKATSSSRSTSPSTRGTRSRSSSPSKSTRSSECGAEISGRKRKRRVLQFEADSDDDTAPSHEEYIAKRPRTARTPRMRGANIDGYEYSSDDYNNDDERVGRDNDALDRHVSMQWSPPDSGEAAHTSPHSSQSSSTSGLERAKNIAPEHRLTPEAYKNLKRKRHNSKLFAGFTFLISGFGQELGDLELPLGGM
jgi:hypothetical protein